jgi:hypothetical protein
MDRRAEVLKQVERLIGQKVFDGVWEYRTVQNYVEDVLSGQGDTEEALDLLVEVVKDRMAIVERSAPEVLGAEGVMRTRKSRRHRGESGELDTDSFVGPKTKAMLRAMSEFFAGLAHQHPEVVRFRDAVLGRKLLSSDEAHALIASPAARALSHEQFVEWDIPVVGHNAEVVVASSLTTQNSGEHSLTLQVTPPDITETVHSASAIYTRLPIEAHGGHTYPSWLWPGSVVDKLYELSEELAEAFDWPSSALDTLGRRRNEAAAWFILTGEAPEVRPLDARWETKGGSEYLNPQWRIRFTAPPWLPEKEVSRAYRMMQKQLLPGRNELREPKVLEVARFVWEQERLNGYHTPSWPHLYETWNKEHPEAQFKSFNNFRTYCMRGVEAVINLNFGWPEV